MQSEDLPSTQYNPQKEGRKCIPMKRNALN